jgi:hypothetical protein
MEPKEYERMIRHYAEGARDIEWIVATCMQYEFGDDQ